jgi:glycosyltransferase involved in cell wall biosynthesis
MVYWAGPGDVKKNFLRWAAGRADESLTGVGYSELVFDVCSELGVPLLALTSHHNPCEARNDLIAVESIPALFENRSGVGYYAAHAQAASLLGRRAKAFGASLVAITEEVAPTAAWLFRPPGAQLIQIRHCSIWPRSTSPSLKERLRWRAHGHVYRAGFAAVLGVSATVTRQVEAVIGRSSPPTLEFVPLWRDDFGDPTPALEPRAPFRVLVVGRLLASKGFFDVLTLARSLREVGPGFVFDVCGDGTDFAAAQRRVAGDGLEDIVRLHGWCAPQALRAHIARCHAVLVPTTPTFNEGFNKVVAEACLGGRPVVASDVCPAVAYVEDAVLTYRGGDLEACRGALLRLATDAALYAAKSAHCRRVARPFLDERFSLRHALRQVLTALRDGRKIERRTILGTPEFAAAQVDPIPVDPQIRQFR